MLKYILTQDCYCNLNSTLGVNGLQGERGSPGPQGPIGLQGVTGAQGVTGGQIDSSYIYAYQTEEIDIPDTGILVDLSFNVIQLSSNINLTSQTQFSVNRDGNYHLDFYATTLSVSANPVIQFSVYKNGSSYPISTLTTPVFGVSQFVNASMCGVIDLITSDFITIRCTAYGNPGILTNFAGSIPYGITLIEIL